MTMVFMRASGMHKDLAWDHPSLAPAPARRLLLHSQTTQALRLYLPETLHFL